jgi:transposase InsO family protein
LTALAVVLHIYDDQSEESSLDFLKRLQAACPIRIRTILTDNGAQFTDRFTSRQKQPSGNHVFDRACASAQIDHRLIPPRHPQTNGMVERFNGGISELLPRPALGTPPNSNKHWTIISWCTTTSSRNRPLDIALPLMHSHHGMLNTLELFIAPVIIQDHNQAERDSASCAA